MYAVNILAQNSVLDYPDPVNKREHYHHGDLRAALIAEGLSQLEAGGEGALSLRGLAKAVGVSPNAPYRHFADKTALMGALAAEGFQRFADAIAAASVGSAALALRAEGKAYLAFAQAHPALYRLMFSPYGYSLTSDTCQREAGRAFGCLVETAQRAQTVGWKSRLPLVDAVLAYWAALHGWAGLTIDKLVPPEVAIPSIDTWLDAVLEGGGEAFAT